MTDTLGGRRALVTGAASGIGRAVAGHLASLGAEVVLSDLKSEALVDAAREVPGSIVLDADLRDRRQVIDLVDAAGAVDILVNNAGLQHVAPIEELAIEQWDRIIDVMLTAPFLLTRGLLPSMYERQWGRIVNIGSVHSVVASPFKAAYVTAKHGLLGMTRTVAAEAAGRPGDVTAHAICPSYVRTPLVERQIREQATVHGIPEDRVLLEVLLARNAVKRLIEPAEVAEAVAWLCGPMAWTMTGAAFTMDAGWLAH